MGFMDKLFHSKDHVLTAPVSGKAVPLSEVPDETFASEMLGQGAAIEPDEGRITSPCDATVDLMFETGHAVTLKTDFGAEILIHVGLDTVNLKGKHYTVHAKNGDKVKKGQLLIEFDKEAVIAEGYKVITPVVICNSDEFSKITAKTGMNIMAGDSFITIEK